MPLAAQLAVSGHDYEEAGKPLIAWEDPVGKCQLIGTLVNDALAIVDALEAVALSAEQGYAVGLLAAHRRPGRHRPAGQS